MNEERKATQYEIHEMALQFPAQTPEEKTQLRDNMVQRVNQGLDPLEFPILLVGGKIADGRHRYQIWQELAAEGACNGYFAKNPIPIEECTVNGMEDEVGVLLKINSRNVYHRNLPAGQKTAILFQQFEKYPALKQIIETARAEAQGRMMAGKPLALDGQGLTTNEVIANMAGVSPSTVKIIKAVQEKAPEQLDDVAKGTISPKMALKKSVEAKKADKPKFKETMPATPKPLSMIKAGDKVFTLQPFEFGAGDISLLEHIVQKVDGSRCHFADGSTKATEAVYDLKGATLRRQGMLKSEIESLLIEVNILRDATKKPPTICPAQKKQASS